MHRDVKLGLALAVLLIGSMTAFLFRNETDLDAGLPQLQNPERLDVEIADQAVVPYLGQPETFDLTGAGDDTETVWTRPAFLGGTMATYRRTSVTPDPIQILLDETTEGLEPIIVPSGGPMLATPHIDGEIPDTHIVQTGDTLTGLASRYLGSMSRYREIFELNRDRLAGPDDLRVGMTLRIPARNGVSLASEIVPSVETAPPAVPEPPPGDSGTSGHEAPAREPETQPARPHAEQLFVPATRAPFVPQRFRGRGDVSRETNAE